MPAAGTKIDPAAWYDDDAICAALDFSYQSLSRARRDGSLRYSRKGNRTLYLGQWLIDWLTADAQKEAAVAS